MSLPSHKPAFFYFHTSSAVHALGKRWKVQLFATKWQSQSAAVFFPCFTRHHAKPPKLVVTAGEIRYRNQVASLTGEEKWRPNSGKEKEEGKKIDFKPEPVENSWQKGSLRNCECFPQCSFFLSFFSCALDTTCTNGCRPNGSLPPA